MAKTLGFKPGDRVRAPKLFERYDWRKMGLVAPLNPLGIIDRFVYGDKGCCDDECEYSLVRITWNAPVVFGAIWSAGHEACTSNLEPARPDQE